MKKKISIVERKNVFNKFQNKYTSGMLQNKCFFLFISALILKPTVYCIILF